MKSYEIVEILENMAIEGRRNFSPLYVCKRLGTENIKEVTAFLFSECCRDILKPNFEVQCPQGDSDFIVHDLNLVPINTVKICHICGSEYIPNLKDIWVTFDFTDDYIKHIKKKTNYISSHIMKRKTKNLLMQV